jgi:hypothetical protein
MESTLDWLKSRQAALRAHFGLPSDAELVDPGFAVPSLSAEQEDHFRSFNLEWHVIPSAQSLPFDDRYFARMYPHPPSGLTEAVGIHVAVRDQLIGFHRPQQGRILAVETTMKPAYLPHNRQYYGSRHGMDRSQDPLDEVMSQARFASGTRYGHTLLELSALAELLTGQWGKRGLLPPGYVVTMCPPVVFNLVGTVFHPEWSETPSLEVGWYTENGTTSGYVVGADAPGDFSYLVNLEPHPDWQMLGFRIALVLASGAPRL